MVRLPPDESWCVRKWRWRNCRSGSRCHSRSRSGRTARLVSAHRPRVPVLAVSPRLETVRRLNLLFGVQCALAEDWTGLTALLDECAELAKRTGTAKSGDLIGITAGLPQQELGTNLFEVHRVP